MASNMSVLSIIGLEHMIAPLLLKNISLPKLKKIHAQIVKFSLSQSNFLVTKMIDICDRNKEINYAILLFNHVTDRNVFLYNAMIRAYTHSHMYVSTLNVYKHMLQDPIFPDKFTYPFVIRSCGGIKCIYIGMQVHGYVCKFGLKCNDLIENSLLDMYIKCEDLLSAHKVFDKMSVRDVISWNSIITGHIKFGHVKKARLIFEEMPDKSIVSWTAMISGYIRVGSYIDALDLFRKMQKEGVKPDYVSLVAVLPACAHLGALEVGKWIHFYANKNGFLKKTSLANSLLEMYTKCGGIEEALQVFEEMREKDVISWSTMILGFANHGKAPLAIELFREMQKTDIKPNEITFVGVLSACAHAGFLNEGLEYFYSMKKEYRIESGIEHYGCLIDLLGRTGNIHQALEFIKSMPMKPDAAIWGSLLSSCRTHNNLEIAVLAMENLLELEPDDSGNYVLLSNIYAKLGNWEGVSKMRKFMRSKSMKKTPGCSLIDVDNVAQEFSSGDNSKPFSENIYQILELLASVKGYSEDCDEIVINDLN